LKNRILISIAALSYLVFYLFSPFFHFHDEWIRNLDKDQFHFHLFAVETNNSDESNCQHIVDQHDEHNHPIVITAVVTNIAPRFENTNSNFYLFQDIKEFDLQIESNKINFVEDFHFDKLLKNKCVHTASNVSPPALVTA
jgi:hypothetical protein